jgi:colicin import membrane protein
MHAAGDRPEFAPPPQPGLLRAFVLAVVAHLLLVLALMHGLQWQRESENAVAEAELWSAVPREAAPREVPVPPPPPAVKAPPQPEPPVVKAPPPPEPPVQRDADIALEREKQQREAEKRKLAEEREERRKLEAQKKREEELARKKREEEIAKKKQEQAKLLAEAKRKEQEAREARDAKRLAELREQNLRRIQGMAGTGAPGSTGSAAQSAGPSASWGAKVQARVRPNIVFTETISGNPKADVEVRTSPDGTIVGKRLVRSSGNKAWDDAVLRALERTESLPRDVDGRVPTPVVIGFSPKA